jgi:hypothetical protein
MPIPLYLYFIAFSLLASLSLVIQPARNLYLKLFPFFLFTTLVIEIISNYLSFYNKPNVNLYNFFGAFEIVFYMFVLSQVIKSPRVKRIVMQLLWVYPLLFFCNILFVQTSGFHSLTYSLGSILIVCFCIYYFYELFQLPHSINLLREPPFWICCGLLFFYCCSFPIFGLLNLLNTIPQLILQSLDIVIMLMNVSLYSLLTIALLCRIRIRKSI